MKQIRLLAQYYVDLMMKLGLVRFSMLLALALVVLAIVVQIDAGERASCAKVV